MRRRFYARLAHLKLLATVAAWRVALADLQDRLTDLDAVLRGCAAASGSGARGDTGLAEALSEARCAVQSDLRTLEAALADAQIRLRALEAF